MRSLHVTPLQVLLLITSQIIHLVPEFFVKFSSPNFGQSFFTNVIATTRNLG